jgi:hypothetical protein
MSLVIDEGSEGPLAAATRAIRDAFPRLIDAFTTKSASDAASNPHTTLIDAHERFQLWLGSVGAAVDRQKRISLEWRLRDAPEIKEEIMSLLNDLMEGIEDCMHTLKLHQSLTNVRVVYAIATGEREKRMKDADMVDVTGDSDSDNVRVDVRAVDEAQDILAVIEDCVRSLLRLAILIKKASPRDRWNRALQRQQDNNLDDSFDIRHVGEKFPKLARPENEWLRFRLGRAITQRRQFIRYSREHKNHLTGQGSHELPPVPSMAEHRLRLEGKLWQDDQGLTPADKALTLLPPRTEASTTASTLHLATLEAVRDEVDEDATSVVSSIVSSFDLNDERGEELRLPTLQAISDGRDEFECPLCFTLQSFRNPRQWKNHAYKDLKPYVCSCGKGECDRELFPDRNTWFAHEIEQHRHHWQCTLCPQSPFETLPKFRVHTQNKHPEIPVSHLSDFMNLCKKPQHLLPAADCPFCDEFETKLKKAEMERGLTSAQDPQVILVPAQNFRRHVASHMEQLALFAMGTTLTLGEPVESRDDISQDKQSVRDIDIMHRYLDRQNEAVTEDTEEERNAELETDIAVEYAMSESLQQEQHSRREELGKDISPFPSPTTGPNDLRCRKCGYVNYSPKRAPFCRRCGTPLVDVSVLFADGFVHTFCILCTRSLYFTRSMDIL